MVIISTYASYISKLFSFSLFDISFLIILATTHICHTDKHYCWIEKKKIASVYNSLFFSPLFR